jgi:homogentisate 1,2-dioxygenase
MIYLILIPKKTDFLRGIFCSFYTPKDIKNESGQHLEHSPFCERDFILPNELETHDEKGDFLIKIKRRNDT